MPTGKNGERNSSDMQPEFHHGKKRCLLGEPLPSLKSGDKVGDIMNSPAITTAPERDLREVASILDERRIKRLPVIDSSGRLVGIISRADIVRAMGKRS